jgi:Tol biopolymer transport system component
VSGELWATDVETGRRDRLLPDFLIEHYSLSADGTRVAFVSIDTEGRSGIWVAAVDGRSAPRRLASFEWHVRALFDPKGGVLFVAGERGAPFLYRIQEDGSGLQKVLPTPISFIYDVSPDGSALGLWEGESVVVYPAAGGTPTLICSDCATAGEENRGVTPPLIKWAPDGKLMYLHSARTRQTFAVPLRPGQVLPPLPTGGLGSLADAARLPGARLLSDARVFSSADASVYAFPRVSTHRNIFRVSVP